MLAVEMKKTKEPAGLPMVGDFLEKTRTFAWPRPDNIVLPSFFSVGGFTDEAMAFCREHDIIVARRIELF